MELLPEKRLRDKCSHITDHLPRIIRPNGHVDTIIQIIGALADQQLSYKSQRCVDATFIW